MSTLIDDLPEAAAWAKQAIIDHSNSLGLGKPVSAVIWTDLKGPDGVLVGADEPTELIAEINTRGLPLFRGHEPGIPRWPSCSCVAGPFLSTAERWAG
jgi:hypothetical protein